MAHIYISSVFCPGSVTSLQAQEPRPQFCRRQVVHRKLRNQGCSFTGDWIGAVSPPLLYAPHSLFSIWTDLKRSERSQGHNAEVRRVDLAKWPLWTLLKFTTGVKYQFHQGFLLDQRSRIPNYSSPHPHLLLEKKNYETQFLCHVSSFLVVFKIWTECTIYEMVIFERRRIKVCGKF